MKIEFILRESTIDDVIGPWCRSGHTDNSSKGGFSFENVTTYKVDSGYITIWLADDSQYIYKMSDFYRIKVSYP